MQNKKLSLGIIGLSEGNGHPYSWAAICNGYDTKFMSECPFPVIPQYLSEQQWPESKIPGVEVTHIWTQSREISENVAKASLIKNIVDKPEEMIGVVDGVLLARDDAENHLEMVTPFLQADLPVFIDKPLALTTAEAEKILSLQQFPSQVFTCSSLRYARELQLTENDIQLIGEIKWVEGSVGKKWATYAVHLVEPIVSQLPERGKFQNVKGSVKGDISLQIVSWENLLAYIKVTGNNPVPLELKFYGSKGIVSKKFYDSFSCFKESLKQFIFSIKNKQVLIPRNETLEIIKVIEWGNI